ncbi:hypothetical protein D3C77_67860 [compost metagenome]
MQGDPGVVDQHADLLIVAQALLDPGQIVCLGEVCGQYLDIDTVTRLEVARQGFETLTVPCNQQQIVPAGGQTLGVHRADAGRSPCDKGGGYCRNN